MKKDLLEECMEPSFLKKLGVEKDTTPESFGQMFCRNCKNDRCFRAGHGRPLWEGRMLNQEDRLYYPALTADGDPRFEHLSRQAFEDAAHIDRSIVIGEDWGVPVPSPLILPPSVPAPSPSPPTSPPQEGLIPGLDSLPAKETPSLLPAQTAKEVLRLPTFNSPRQMNVVVPGEGVDPVASGEVDPWAPPTPVKTSKGLVKKGKAYRFGGEG